MKQERRAPDRRATEMMASSVHSGADDVNEVLLPTLEEHSRSSAGGQILQNSSTLPTVRKGRGLSSDVYMSAGKHSSRLAELRSAAQREAQFDSSQGPIGMASNSKYLA